VTDLRRAAATERVLAVTSAGSALPARLAALSGGSLRLRGLARRPAWAALRPGWQPVDPAGPAGAAWQRLEAACERAAARADEPPDERPRRRGATRVGPAAASADPIATRTTAAWLPAGSARLLPVRSAAASSHPASGAPRASAETLPTGRPTGWRGGGERVPAVSHATAGRASGHPTGPVAGEAGSIATGPLRRDASSSPAAAGAAAPGALGELLRRWEREPDAGPTAVPLAGPATARGGATEAPDRPEPAAAGPGVVAPTVAGGRPGPAATGPATGPTVVSVPAAPSTGPGHQVPGTGGTGLHGPGTTRPATAARPAEAGVPIQVAWPATDPVAGWVPALDAELLLERVEWAVSELLRRDAEAHGVAGTP
jgi:syndecan 1